MKNIVQKLSEAATKTINKRCFEILTMGQTFVDGKYMYLDRNKYKGKGRPKKSDYKETQPLFSNQ